MSFVDIDIANRALALIGEDPITSFGGDSEQSRRFSVLYESVVRAELASFPWRFAIKQELLNRLVDDPIGEQEWSSAYRLPRSALRVTGVFVKGRKVKFDRYSEYIYCNTHEDDEVYAEFIYRADEGFWEEYFAQVVVFRLASLMGGSIGRDATLVEQYNALYDIEKARARHTDSQGRTNNRIRTNRFLANRNTHGA